MLKPEPVELIQLGLLSSAGESMSPLLLPPAFSFLISRFSSATFFHKDATSFKPLSRNEDPPTAAVLPDSLLKYLDISRDTSLPKHDARPGFVTVTGLPSSLNVSSHSRFLIESERAEILLLLAISSFKLGKQESLSREAIEFDEMSNYSRDVSSYSSVGIDESFKPEISI